MILSREFRTPVIAVGVGLLYGLLSRLAFGSQPGPLREYLGVMTVGFIFLVPLAIGAITVYLASEWQQRSWGFAILAPWLTTILTLAVAFLVHLEGMICIVMIFPVFLALASVGGLVICAATHISDRRGHTRLRSHALAVIVVLPYLVGPVERQLGLVETERVVANQVRIRADAATVWRNIARVPEIRPEEQTVSMAHRIGFPKPLEATLSHEGVGGVRHASFERGIVFIETVTEWEPERRLSFTIAADPESIPAKALDEHVTVGGPYFDVLTGTYEIERVGPDEVVLHLSSRHRLSTTFNPYARLWTDWVMRDVQENILHVVRRRAEAEAARSISDGTVGAR